MLGNTNATARRDRESMITWQREFVADASHELRTPLTSTLANLEILEEMMDQQGAEADEERKIVASALHSSRRMRKLVNDLVLLARADANRDSPRKPCDLSEIVAEAVREVMPMARDHRIDLEAPEPTVVDGNPDELHRLVVNLVDNAVRHTPSGTNVKVRLDTSDGRAVVEVSDDGPGIERGLRERVFDRFVHGHGRADRSTGGVGLGLAIVRVVAESHGGSARVDDAEAGGARFVVELPQVEERQLASMA